MLLNESGQLVLNLVKTSSFCNFELTELPLLKKPVLSAPAVKYYFNYVQFALLELSVRSVEGSICRRFP